MESLFTLAARQLMPTVGQMADQNEEELKESLIELWEHELIRWVVQEDENEDDGRFFLEIVTPDGTWERMGIPRVH